MKIKKIMGLITLIIVVITFTGCSNTTYSDINEAYNKKRGTQNRSVILDTVVASTLMNNPEILDRIVMGKRVGHSKSKSETNGTINSTTNSWENSETITKSSGNEISSQTTNTSMSTTNTVGHSTTKTHTKGSSASVGINPLGLFF